MFFPICRLTGHAADVTRARISPDMSTIASASADKSVFVWDTTTGRAVRSLEDHSAEVADICYHGSGSGIFTACLDGKARLFDLRSRASVAAAIFKASEGDELSCLAGGNSVNSPVLLAGSTSGNINFFDIRSRTLAVTTFGHYNAVCSLDVSKNDSMATSSSLDGTIRIWSVARGDGLLTVNEKTSCPSPCVNAGFTFDGQGVIGIFLNSSLRRWNFKDRINSEIKFMGPKITSSTKTFTHVDEKGGIAVPSEDGSVYFINSNTGRSIQEPFKAHSDDILSVECRGDLMVSSGAGEDSSVVIWSRILADEPRVDQSEDYSVSFHLVSPQIEGLI